MYIIKKIETFKYVPLIGGLVEALSEQIITNEDGLLILSTIAIIQIETTCHTNHYKFITQNRNLAAVNQEMLCSLQVFNKKVFNR